MPHKDPVVRKAYFKDYNAGRKEETAEYNAYYQMAHPELKQANADWQKSHPLQRAVSQKKYRKDHATEISLRARQRHVALRTEVIASLGGKCACPGCTETEFEFLGIDHVKGGGTKHRKEMKGNKILRLLKKSGPSPDYQILCHNCNFSKHIGSGKCIHVRRQETSL